MVYNRVYFRAADCISIDSLNIKYEQHMLKNISTNISHMIFWGAVILSIFCFGTLTASAHVYTNDITKNTAYEDTYSNIQKKQNPYSIARKGDPVTVLFVHSNVETVSELKEFQKRLNIFQQIISSHWNIEKIETLPASEYNTNDILEFDVVFAIDEFGTELPKIFIDDVLKQTEKKIVWVGAVPIDISKLLQIETNITQEVSVDSFYVNYKDVSFFTKELNITDNIVSFETDRTKILVTLEQNSSEQSIPIIQFVDDQFLFLAPVLPHWYQTDSYTTPLLDSLHLTLGSHGQKCNALLRLEDINPHTYSNFGSSLARAYEFLKSNEIPFHIAYIERYINPKEHIDITARDKRWFRRLMQRMAADDLVTFIQHGYTHQIGDEVSAIGFEFWDIEKNSPLTYDSEEYVHGIVASARKGMKKDGLPVTDIWETPHYALSDLDNDVLNELYPIRYEHIPNIGSLPFVVLINGTIFIPENLGYVFDEMDIEKIKYGFKQLRTFEDLTASFFWHPWRDPRELKYLINYTHNNECQFVSAYDLIERDPDENLVVAHSGSVNDNQYSGYEWMDYLLVIAFLSFTFGIFLYVRNRYRIRKYYDTAPKFDMSLKDVQSAIAKKNSSLPKIGIFVPARNEGYVIENTIRRLDKMDYPKDRYAVFVIVDERELADDVEITTRDAVNKTMTELHKEHGVKYIQCIEVPKWYSGKFDNYESTYKNSTKGRALNYCLQVLRDDEVHIDVIGVLDADGRLDKNILKEVAYKYVVKDQKLLQGPVFQVSNFTDVSIVGKMAALELALHHITELPARLSKEGKMQFLAGTNYFIHSDFIISVNGWDQDALVEDAELAMRLYVQRRVTASLLTLPEIEQTPPSMGVYFKQRERWVRGHFDLIIPILRSGLKFSDKFDILSKIVISQFRFIFDICVIAIAVTLLVFGEFHDTPQTFTYASYFFMIFSILILDIYGLIYRRVVYYTSAKTSRYKRTVRSIQFFIFTPIFMLIQLMPRFYAIWNYVFKRDRQSWYKTQRTKEVVMEQ